MKTYAVINQKGGVGKSTTAHAIGTGLAAKGYKILFVDMDAQCNLTYTLKASDKGYNILGVLERPETAKEEIQHAGGVDIIAASPSLTGADAIINATGKEYRLKEALDPLKKKYDYCIIDTPPALGILTVNALTAATGAIIPAQADKYSLYGISQLSSTIEAIKKYCNPSLKIMGILITRYNARAIIRREIAEVLEDTARKLHTRLYKTRIRECTALVEAHTREQSIFEYAPKSNAAKDYNELIEEILEQEREQ